MTPLINLAKRDHGWLVLNYRNATFNARRSAAAHHRLGAEIELDPTVNTLNRRRGHYNARKLSTCSFPVRIEMLRLMNKMSARFLNFLIGWHKPLKFWKCNQMSQINHDGILQNISVLYSNSRIFVIPVYIFNGRKQKLGILSVLRMRGLHDKHHLLAKLRICGSVIGRERDSLTARRATWLCG